MKKSPVRFQESRIALAYVSMSASSLVIKKPSTINDLELCLCYLCTLESQGLCLHPLPSCAALHMIFQMGSVQGHITVQGKAQSGTGGSDSGSHVTVRDKGLTWWTDGFLHL